MFGDRVWRALYWTGFRLARQWWRLRRPPHDGALVALWVGDRVLLLRQSYRAGWCFPGGGIQGGETAEAAIAREAREEIGLSVATADLRPVREITGDWDWRRERVRMFELHLDEEPALRVDNREIVGAAFVDADAASAMRLTPPVRTYLARRFPAPALPSNVDPLVPQGDDGQAREAAL